jgi:hypothetical protein
MPVVNGTLQRTTWPIADISANGGKWLDRQVSDARRQAERAIGEQSCCRPHTRCDG